MFHSPGSLLPADQFPAALFGSNQPPQEQCLPPFVGSQFNSIQQFMPRLSGLHNPQQLASLISQGGSFGRFSSDDQNKSTRLDVPNYFSLPGTSNSVNPWLTATVPQISMPESSYTGPSLKRTKSPNPESNRMVLGKSKRRKKEIPMANDPVDLNAYANKPVEEWMTNEVLSWVLSVARILNIPIENLCLYNFLDVSGEDLCRGTESQFISWEPSIGRLLYTEFCRIIGRTNEQAGPSGISDYRTRNLNGEIVTGSLLLPTQCSNSPELERRIIGKCDSVDCGMNRSTETNVQRAESFESFEPTSSVHIVKPDAIRASVVHLPSNRSVDLNTDSSATQSMRINRLEKTIPDIVTVSCFSTSFGPPIPSMVSASSSAVQQLSSTLFSTAQQLSSASFSEESTRIKRELSSPSLHSPISPADSAATHRLLEPFSEDRVVEPEANTEGTSSRLLIDHEEPKDYQDSNDTVLDFSSKNSEHRENGIKETDGKAPTTLVFKRTKAGTWNTTQSDTGIEIKERKRTYRSTKRKNVLWKFILDLLNDPFTSPSIVKWEDKSQGIFRITNSTQLAGLWDEKKDRRSTMNYEKLSRAMRGYYKDSIVLPGPKNGLYPKKLVYQFGPNAHGWQKVAGLED